MNIAKLVENVFFPSNVGVVGTVIIIIYLRTSPFSINHILALFILLAVYKVFRKVFQKSRSETKRFTYPGVAAIITFLLFVAVLPVERKFIFSAFSFIPINFIIHFVRDWWKISGHSMTYATFSTVLTLTDIIFAPLFLLLPLVMWSRLKLKRHSLKQVLAGVFTGLSVPLILYFIFNFI